MTGYSIFAKYYDELTSNVDYPARAAYFSSLIRRTVKDANLVLDLACGTGSLTLELCKLGYDMIGTDSSTDMLGVAMQKSFQADKQILFLNQSMEDLDLYGTVDAVVCALDSINHLPDENALDIVFSRVSLFCKPGGVFLFDVNTRYKHREILADNAYIYETENVFCAWQNQLGENDQIDVFLDFFEKTGKYTYSRFSESFSEYIFDEDVVEKTLLKNKFKVDAIYAADTLSPPVHDTQRLIYVVRRQ